MRVKKGLGIDVLESAKQRIRRLFTKFDTLVVSFSGGKDSLVLLELVEEVRIELGIEDKLTVIFYDEELIQADIVDFVTTVATSGRFNFRWICAPLHSERFILGNKMNYIQWDVTRQWVRPMPTIAEDFTHLEASDETNVFNDVFRGDYGSIASLIGIRTQESNTRHKAVMGTSNLDSPDVVDVSVGYATARPIYDWAQDDIFKYIHDRGLDYCRVYDRQTWGKAPLRVATPFNVAASKQLHKLKEYDPEFYDSLLVVFPEMAVQAQYYKYYDNTKVFDKYGVTPEGIIDYAKDNLGGGDLDRCLKALSNMYKKRAEDIAIGRFPRYPLRHIFYRVIIGGYKKYIQPMTDAEVNDEIREYEIAYEEYKQNNPDYKFE